MAYAIKDIGNLEDVCPYCSKRLTKRPLSKAKCPHCGNFIRVRTRPTDRKRVLVTENQAEEIETQWNQIKSIPPPRFDKNTVAVTNCNFEWCQSAAHLLFLSEFLTPIVPIRFRDSEEWTKVLGKTPQETVTRFLEDRVIEPPGPAKLLNYGYQVSDLKAMLKDRRQPVSGQKNELIDRLVTADPEGIKSVTSTVNLLQCSETGRSIAENFLLRAEEKRIRAEEQVREKLIEHKFCEAALLVASFESDQVFPRRLFIYWGGAITQLDVKWWHCWRCGAEWGSSTVEAMCRECGACNYDPAVVVAMLESMFSRKPRILASIKDEQLEKLRIAAGMIHLWGTDRLKLNGWLPDFDASLRMNSLSAARMIIADARHQYRVAIYKAAGVQTVEILPKTDMSTCDNCFEIADRTYGIEEVPDLPYELCTSDMGCRCVVNNASRETDFITLKEILENLKRLTPEERKLIQSQILDRFTRRRV